MNKFGFSFSVLSILMLFSKIPVFAQSLPVGTPVFEDFYRREQLLGKIDSNVSFTIRPLFPVVDFNARNIFDPDSVLSADDPLKNNGIYKTRNGEGVLQVLSVNWLQQYNTHNPYGWNDGPMIPAAGYQSLFSAGIYAKYKFLSVQLQPEFVYAQNKNFDGFTQAGNNSNAWVAWYDLNNYIDMPERFGKTPYSKLFAGQSSIRITFDPVSFGVSTEDLWWGPGIRNSLIMSNNAPGFLHLTLNTTRPVKTPIGSFETQIIAGKLDGSGYSPLVPGQPGNHDTLNMPKLNDWRYLSGVVFTYQPKWVPGLFLGITRVYQVYESDMGHGFSDYFPIFTSFFKADFYNSNNGVNTDDAKKHDQLASIFMRWLWPAANAEIYAEYGREDHNWNSRDLLLDPQHTRAYIFGFRKLFRAGSNPDENIQIGFEETQMAQPPDDIINRPNGYWYAHSIVRSGYTNDGQVLGAGIGPGSSLLSMDVSWVKGLNKIGLQIERYEHNQDFYYYAFPPGNDRRHWVDYSAGINTEWPDGHIIFSASLLYVKELNYQWKFTNNPNLSYFNQQNDDANNFEPSLSMSYRF